MAYVDERGRKYEFQYCVILREGENSGLKHYFWASEEGIRNVMKKIEELPCCSEQDNGNRIVCGRSINGADYEITFNLGKIGSLELRVKDLKSARDILLKLSEKT